MEAKAGFAMWKIKKKTEYIGLVLSLFPHLYNRIKKQKKQIYKTAHSTDVE